MSHIPARCLTYRHIALHIGTQPCIPTHSFAYHRHAALHTGTQPCTPACSLAHRHAALHIGALSCISARCLAYRQTTLHLNASVIRTAASPVLHAFSQNSPCCKAVKILTFDIYYKILIIESQKQFQTVLCCFCVLCQVFCAYSVIFIDIL